MTPRDLALEAATCSASVLTNGPPVPDPPAPALIGAADGPISRSQKEHLGNSGNDFRLSTKKTFRLIPAPPGSHWSLVRNWGEVSVTARTSGEARAIAAAQEGLKLKGNVRSNYRASAFLDPKLYSVREVQSTNAEIAGRCGSEPHLSTTSSARSDFTCN